MRIAVCGSQSGDRSAAAELLLSYCADHNIHCELQPFSSGVDLLCDVEDGAWYDIVFLDIHTDQLPGLDAARELRQLRYPGSLIFLSSGPESAVAGYDVGASGYLLKPLCADKLGKCMDRIVPNLELCTYQVRRRRQVTHIPYSDILFVESSNSKCHLHLRSGGTSVVYKKLNEIELELNDPRFLRCHQSYLVNLDYVQRMDRQFELTSGDTVLIRQRSLKAIRQIYLDYTTDRASFRRPGNG